MRLIELKSGGSFAQLPMLASEAYVVRSISDYWDGMLAGLLSIGDREYWFEVFQENTEDKSLDKWFRRYAVVLLTEEQLAKEHEINEAFLKHVGVYPNLRPRDEHRHFYDRYLEYCRSAPYSDNEVVAWFEQ